MRSEARLPRYQNRRTGDRIALSLAGSELDSVVQVDSTVDARSYLHRAKTPRAEDFTEEDSLW